jgi:hypothetical protein
VALASGCCQDEPFERLEIMTKLVDRDAPIPEGMFAPPEAANFKFTFCDACPNAHFLFVDAEGVPICQATLTEGQAFEIVRAFVERRR